MKISNQFRVPLPIGEAWAALNDIPRVAPCAPGAELVEVRPDGSYVGRVKVKLGPVALSFQGTLVYKERDEKAHRVVAEATGDEARARGTARAQVSFTLSEEGGGTRVDVESDIQLAGSIAQYGRGAALVQSTAQVLMDEFAKNFAAQLSGGDSSSKYDGFSKQQQEGGGAGDVGRPVVSAPPISATKLLAKSAPAIARSAMEGLPFNPIIAAFIGGTLFGVGVFAMALRSASGAGRRS